MLSDLSALPHNLNARRECRAIVETPRGSRQKFAYDPTTGAFRLRHVLAAGMSFPIDFGFIPSTKAEDGDALDVMIMADEPLFAGCQVDIRLIGVVEALQTADGETYRNDRLMAAPLLSRRYGQVERLDDLPTGLVEEINQFWTTYNHLRGRTFEVLGLGDAARAASLVEAASSAS
jgi:inorganic pyrophosphatase